MGFFKSNDKSSWRNIRELTNRRLLHDAAVRLRDILTAHAFLSTCQLRAKGDDVRVFLPDNLSITLRACP